MSESPARRDVLKIAAGLAVTGWLWQATPAQADTPADVDDPTPGQDQGTSSQALDEVVFGDSSSETAHSLTATNSSLVTGGLSEAARVLNPPSTAGVWGGTLAVTLACDPVKPTYVTIKLWGDEAGLNLGRLQLFAAGLQIGHYHLGAVDPLDIADTDPVTPGRFFFHTLPLPLELTSGQTSIDLEIRSMGQIGVYGATAAEYWNNMIEPSRTVYRLYTHTTAYLALDSGDAVGTAPVAAVRTSPGSEALTAAMTQVYDQVTAEVNRTSAQLDLWYLDFLARAYRMSSTTAYLSPLVPGQIARSLDGIYADYQTDSTQLTASTQQWEGFGRVGQLMLQFPTELDPLLDEAITGSTNALVNPGFEISSGTLPLGWIPSTWAGSGTMSWDSTEAHTGNYSVKVVAGTGATVGFVPTDRTQIGQGTYEYGAWIKTDSLAGPGAYIDVLFYDATATLVGTDHKYYAATGTNDWAYVSASLATPATATQFQMHLRVAGAGTAWFDDLVLTPPSGTTPAVTRRTAYASMLQDSREYWRQNFPQYTNQAVICALGIYLADRGLAAIAPAQAWTETKARGYLYQALGLSPWLGPEAADGTPSLPLGGAYLQVTPNGITRELGYAGNYGSIQQWLSMVYEAVRYAGVTDATLNAQLAKMAKARGYFTYPAQDSDGYRAMRCENVIGWRDCVYPGKIAYDEVVDWDGHPLRLAALLDDPDLTAYAQQEIADNQFYNLIAQDQAQGTSSRVNLNLLSAADDYATVTAATGSGASLPMTAGQPDFVLTDEVNCTVALKHGTEIFYASLYWRARWGINRLARIHHISDGIERAATVWCDVEYVPDGRTFDEPDWVDWEFVSAGSGIPDGGFPPPGPTLHQAFAGQELPLAASPSDMPPRDPGVENPYAGRASFYRCVYGSYLIAMNSSADESYTLVPGDFGASVDLSTGDAVAADASITVAPMTTVVLYRSL